MEQERQYILKNGMKEQIRMIKTNRDIANDLGINEGYISQIINRRKTKISKLMAYGFCKAVSPDLEISDLFDVK